jgi:hypothetical protein
MQVQPAVVLGQASGVTHSRIGCGIVTSQALEGILHTTVRILDCDQPDIYLADFRRPLWAISEDELGRGCVGLDPRLVAPAALLVTTENYALFRRHAWQMAQVGILRKVFTDEVAASEWCQLRLALVRQERTAPRSPPPGRGPLGR